MTNDEIRRYRLNDLIGEYRTIAALARHLGISPSQISQWKNASPDSKTGKPRTISDGAARRMESECKKERGWMDTPPPHYQASGNGRDDVQPTMRVLDPTYTNQAEIKAQARTLSQRAHAVSAMWMKLDPHRQDEIEASLLRETGADDHTDAATRITPGKRSGTSKVKTGTD